MDPLNLDTLLYSDAEPKRRIFLPNCSLAPTAMQYAVELRGPHLDGILTLKFANQKDLNIMSDIFNKSRSLFLSAHEAFKEVKYVAAGGKAADIRSPESVGLKAFDIHGVGLTLGYSRNGKSITVCHIAPGSPAALSDAAISVHDHLLKVDDLDVKHSCTSLEDIAKRIRGLTGTPVKLLLRRSRDLEPEGGLQVQEGQARAPHACVQKAKTKYEVVLRRGPPVAAHSDDTSGSEAREMEGSGGAVSEQERSGNKQRDVNSIQEEQLGFLESNSADNIAASNGISMNEKSNKVLSFRGQEQLLSSGHAFRQDDDEQGEQRRSIYDMSRISDGSEFETSGSKLQLPDRPYRRMLECASPKQELAIKSMTPRLQKDVTARATTRKTQKTPSKELSFLRTDIGIIFCAGDAVDGRPLVVHSIQPDAPQSVQKYVFAGDTLLSIDGHDVARARTDAVLELLKRSST
jgi:C-terminal processing protease CtpA/Prc